MLREHVFVPAASFAFRFNGVLFLSIPFFDVFILVYVIVFLAESAVQCVPESSFCNGKLTTYIKL